MKTTRIIFPTNPMTSDLGSHGINVSGIEVSKTIAYDHKLQEQIHVVEIFPINSAGDTSPKFLRLPMEMGTLRHLANTLNNLADQAEGSDITSRIQGYVADANVHFDGEAVTEALDDLIHDAVPNSRNASNLNNQGWQAQITYLVLNGYGIALRQRFDAFAA